MISSNENVSVWSAIYKKRLFDYYKFDKNLRIAEDWLLNYQLSTVANALVITNKHLYHYFSNVDGTMHEDSVDKLMDNIYVGEYFWEHEINEPLLIDCVSNTYVYIAFILIGTFVRKNLCYTDEHNSVRTSLKKKKKYLFKAKINKKRCVKLFGFLYFPKTYIWFAQWRSKKDD